MSYACNHCVMRSSMLFKDLYTDMGRFYQSRMTFWKSDMVYLIIRISEQILVGAICTKNATECQAFRFCTLFCSRLPD